MPSRGDLSVTMSPSKGEDGDDSFLLQERSVNFGATSTFSRGNLLSRESTSKGRRNLSFETTSYRRALP